MRLLPALALLLPVAARAAAPIPTVQIYHAVGPVRGDPVLEASQPLDLFGDARRYDDGPRCTIVRAPRLLSLTQFDRVCR